MKKLQNETLQKLLDRFVKELKRQGEYYEDHDRLVLDIPFIVSTLYQNFDTNEDEYKEFVNDLEKYPDYNLYITKSSNDYNGIIDLDIRFGDYEYYNISKFEYKICFSYDERLWKYCQCTPDMPDYREDKKCCGHECDASFCSFSLHKVLTVGSGTWIGDEHDYWNFEDEFYASEKELKDKKEKEDVEKKIKELQEIIETSKQKLYELLGGC